MRYIADESGCLKEVSFGAIIVCGGQSCKAYAGGVPDGYSSLADWYLQENEKLYRWKIVNENLTLDSAATAPEMEWVNPPMLEGVEYRTTERWQGKPVYRKLVVYSVSGQIGNENSYTNVSVPHDVSGFVGFVHCRTTVNNDCQLPFVAQSGGVTAVRGCGSTNIDLRIVKDVWNSPTFYFDLAYVKE